MLQTNSQLMVLVDILINMKVLLAPELTFTSTQPLNLLLFDNQLHLFLSWSTYHSPHCYCVTLSSPCPDCLVLIINVVGFLLIIVIFFSLSCILVLIVFSSSIFLFNITALIIVMIVSSLSLYRLYFPCLFASSSSPSPHHFAYNLNGRLFFLSISLWLYLSQLSSPFYYSLILVLIPLLLLVTITGALLLVSSSTCDIFLLVSSPCKYHLVYPCLNHLFVCLVSLRLLLLKMSSPCTNFFSFSWLFILSLSRLLVRFSLSLRLLAIFLSSSLLLFDISFLILPIIVSSLSWLFYPFTYYFTSPCCNRQRAHPCHNCLDFASILMPLKHYQQYQKLWQGFNFKKYSE